MHTNINKYVQRQLEGHTSPPLLESSYLKMIKAGERGDDDDDDDVGGRFVGKQIVHVV